MTTRLHVTNGDSAADLIRQSGIEGDVLAWRDPMHHGPFPHGLDLDASSAVRARYLAGDSLDPHQIEQEFRRRNDRLRRAARDGEIVLWFEHDLLDQLQILEILHWFDSTTNGETAYALELICIDRFAGVDRFRGLGQLTPDQLAGVFATRQPVRADQLRLAANGWRAFTDPNPCALVNFLSEPLTQLPFLRPALLRHLAEYPWASDGLTRTERQLLRLIAEGMSEPGRLFAANMDLETELFIGDWATCRTLATLCHARQPLVQTATGARFECPPSTALTRQAVLDQRLHITEAGTAVLAGTRHAGTAIDRDMWLGGVHIKSGGQMWLWNSDTQSIDAGA